MIEIKEEIQNHLNLETGLCFSTVGLHFHRKYYSVKLIKSLRMVESNWGGI